LAKRNVISGNVAGAACATAQMSIFRNFIPPVTKLGLGLILCGLSYQATAQLVAPVTPTTTPDQEQRRVQERDRALRDLQERRPDVRLAPFMPTGAARLPTEEICFAISGLRLRTPSIESKAVARNWVWVLDAAAGPARDDSPSGRCIGAAGVNLILKRLQEAVIARGYVTTRVVAEPQDLTSGILIFTVIPGLIRDMRLSAGSARTAQWNAIPARVGDTVNLRDIEQALENLKRVPSAEADISIEPASAGNARPGDSDLVITYKQAFPLRVSLFADDSGLQATGKYQGGATFSADNLLTLSDLLYVTLNRDLGGTSAGERGTRGRSVVYSVPWGYWLLGVSASSNRYRQSVAGVNQTYLYSGDSSNADVKLSRLMYRDASRKTTLGLRAFQRSSKNFIDDTEVFVQRRVVGGFEASVNHREFLRKATLDLSLAYKRGTGAFGSLPAPEQALGEGTARMQLATLDLALNAPFKALDQNLRYSGLLRAQANQTRLSPQDRFAIAGRYTVRGFDGETSLSAERGVLLRNDIGLQLDSTGQETYVGVDYGRVSGPSSEFLVGKKLVGAVLGLRGGIKSVQYDVFIGKPMSRPQGFKTAQYTAGFHLNYGF
jgi:hemolysin activation/secretion protein